MFNPILYHQVDTSNIHGFWENVVIVSLLVILVVTMILVAIEAWRSR